MVDPDSTINETNKVQSVSTSASILISEEGPLFGAEEIDTRSEPSLGDISVITNRTDLTITNDNIERDTTPTTLVVAHPLKQNTERILPW